jgi:pilus assembly protein Flp/PilA
MALQGQSSPGSSRVTFTGVRDMKNFVRFLRDESGATAIEYALIVAVIGGAVVAVGPTVTSTFTNLFTKAQTATGGGS